MLDPRKPYPFFVVCGGFCCFLLNPIGIAQIVWKCFVKMGQAVGRRASQGRRVSLVCVRSRQWKASYAHVCVSVCVPPLLLIKRNSKHRPRRETCRVIHLGWRLLQVNRFMHRTCHHMCASIFWQP